MNEKNRESSGAENFLEFLELIPGFLKKLVSDPPFPGDITHAQLKVMFILRKKNGIRMSDFAKVLNVTPGSLTVMIDRLCQENMVERYAGFEDRRMIGVRLSPKGEQILDTYRGELARRLSIFIAAIPPGEQDELVYHLGETTRLLRKHLSTLNTSE